MTGISCISLLTGIRLRQLSVRQQKFCRVLIVENLKTYCQDASSIVYYNEGINLDVI